MEEPGVEISSTMEEGNPGHAASTPSINDAEKVEVDYGRFTASKDSILRIPDLFKMRNQQAYTPYKFSIGPWHYGKTQLLRMGQNLKQSFFQGLIARFRNRAAKEKELKEAINMVKHEAIGCYEGGYDCFEGKTMDEAAEEFEKILLLDGCFIIELFRKYAALFSKNAEQVSTEENEFVHLVGGMIHVVYHDLLLLDNQIPWFVLDLLFEVTSVRSPRTDFTLVALAMEFFGRVVFSYGPRSPTFPQCEDSSIVHLVHFLWRFWDVSSEREQRKGIHSDLEYGTLIPSVTRLKEMGVKFQKAESRNILNVKFNKGVLQIPPLLITPSTETIFRNLIIFEQCSLLCTPRVTSYAILLDCLVDTSDDVHLMNTEGILVNTLNPGETANFLNRVRDNALTQELFYAGLRKDINEYCKKGWPRWRASLIHNYFTKPWAIVSVVFATIVLFFTIMQVFYK